MNAYDIALFVHLASLLLASSAATLAMHAALRLRHATSAEEAGRGLRFVGRVVRLFPVAILGLLATGAYMTHARWGWSLPWIQASAAGLGLIVVLGSGIEAGRSRVLGRELAANGLSPRARRLLRDPVSWSAKLMTQTMALAVVLVMTMKPGTTGAAGALAAALVVGLAAAVPFWRAPTAPPSSDDLVGRPLSSSPEQGSESLGLIEAEAHDPHLTAQPIRADGLQATVEL